MNIYQKLPQLTESIITIGSFDGLHLGHQFLINEVKKIADENKLPFYLISFEPHPRLVLQNNSDFKLLQTWAEKISQLEKLGVEHLIAIPFTRDLSQKSAEEFIQDYILKPLNPRIVVLGYDHKFGRDRQGSIDTFLALKEKFGLNLEVKQLQEYMNQRSHISSSIIRHHIQHGRIEQANELLGYQYSVTGKVIEGKKLGRTLGFPTANVLSNDIHKLIPAIGVYHTTIEIDGVSYKSATSIGFNPTVENIDIPKIETYIIDFMDDIYGKEVVLRFHHYIRGEEKYGSIDELKLAIEQDVITIKNNSD
ncbi:MAG: bifunctional riboflavin kinase/FAD synthetase [Chitinophagales bacterium]|nr:bifunctional riboflavin kinase/FAD synthetase [Chitinophagales bacterium]